MAVARTAERAAAGAAIVYRPAEFGADTTPAHDRHRDRYLRHLFLPWLRGEHEMFVACAEADDATRAAIAETCGLGVRLLPMRKQMLVDAIQRRFGAQLAHDAEFHLEESQPVFSARRVVTPAQRWVALALGMAAAAGSFVAPEIAEAVFFAGVAALYAANIAARLLLYACGWSGKGVRRVKPQDLAEANDADFPLYTILVPLYREANMIPSIVRALERIDYPRLDIKLIFEEHDADTIAAARDFRLDGRFEILVVPPSDVRTKPRACNYGLAFARGEYVVIFDAEDRPERDQLKKAALAFHAEPDIACLQASLAFYNTDEPSWFVKMFALEYGAWFRIMLPGLARLGVPIPLGGTSNHFRASVLRAVGAWDAYNVTEDEDLGLRLARAGHRVAPLESVTWEEAASRLHQWIPQRSRWLKGYMQTVLVHLREPRAFARSVGWWRYVCSLLFVGGAVATALIGPAVWMLSALWAATGLGPSGGFYDWLFPVSLIAGNAILTALAMLAPVRTGERGLAAWGLGVFFYWLLISVASYRALAQLICGKSSLWEKTMHGIARPRAWRFPPVLPPRPALAHAALALALIVLSACAALANPWLKLDGEGEAVATLRLMRSASGFAAGQSDDGALDTRGEFGVTDRITLVMDAEAKSDSGSGERLEFAQAGARMALLRWDTGVVSLEGEAGAGALRSSGGQPFFGSLHARGEARVLIGQDFSLAGSHAWLAVEAGWRWRGGPPADEAIGDVTLGVQPRDDLFFMLQSFGILSARNATDGYRAYNSDKLQLSAVYEFTPGLWIQAGAIASVAGDDEGDAGGMAALWWRF